MTEKKLVHSRSVAVTGATGNLGWKLLNHLVAESRAPRLVGLDIRPPDPERLAALRRRARRQAGDREPPDIEMVQCDLARWHDQRWRETLTTVDAVVHFAAQNPYPEASWADCARSLDMTLHVAQAAADSPSVERFVFATSNHVMGRYKDPPLADSIGPGELSTDLPPGVGTVWHTGQEWMDSTAYATAKLAGERICQALAVRAAGRTTFVCIRIGWCQPGQNRPETLSAAGTPTQESGPASRAVDAEDLARADRWFKEMWLSNQDFVHLFERAIAVDGGDWPNGFILVNGMSANRGMKWSLAETTRWLGYDPQDDVYAG